MSQQIKHGYPCEEVKDCFNSSSFTLYFYYFLGNGSNFYTGGNELLENWKTNFNLGPAVREPRCLFHYANDINKGFESKLLDICLCVFRPSVIHLSILNSGIIKKPEACKFETILPNLTVILLPACSYLIASACLLKKVICTF